MRRFNRAFHMLDRFVEKQVNFMTFASLTTRKLDFWAAGRGLAIGLGPPNASTDAVLCSIVSAKGRDAHPAKLLRDGSVLVMGVPLDGVAGAVAYSTAAPDASGRATL